MSAYPVTPAPMPTAARRPGTLTAAIVVVVMAALAAIVNGIMIATGGSDLIKDILTDAGLPADMLTDENLESAAVIAGYSSLEEFESTFAMRGYLVLAAGVALIVFGLLMRKAATWARALVTVSALLALAFSGMIIADETTSTMALLAMVTILFGLIAIILTWLPANGRYAKSVS